MTDADKSEVHKRTRTLFATERGTLGRRQWVRIHICPFENLLPQVPKGSHILDIGCGGGLFLGLLALGDPALRATGIDSSPKAVGFATRMANRLSLHRLRFLQADNIGDWPEEQFSIVSLIDVLHHVSPHERRTFFHKSAQHVAKGGKLICKDMRPKPRWKAAANILHDLIFAREWIHHVSAQTVEGWAREAGLRLMQYEEWDRLWYGHALWVFQREN